MRAKSARSRRWPTLALPPAVWARIAGFLDDGRDRLALALVQKACAEGVAMRETGVCLNVVEQACSRQLPTFTYFPRQISAVLVTSSPPGSLAQHSTPLSSEGAEQHEMWRSLDAAWKPGRFQWVLSKLCDRLGLKDGGHARPGTRTLRISLPSMACSARDLSVALQRAGVLHLFTSIALDRGLTVLDGALTESIIRANTTTSLLLPILQAPCTYHVLWDLAVQVSSSDELGSLLEAITPATLPALRSLALVAEPGDDVGAIRADFSALEHPGITQLTLNSIELSGGFATLEHLTGLQSLAAWYEEDSGPPLNLGGDLAALSALSQLSCLALHNLASSEGLSTLRHLTSLSFTPQPGSRLHIHGLPALQTFSVDLTCCGSSGRELLQPRSIAHLPPGTHGLSCLQQLELRCFMWGRPPAATGVAEADAGPQAAEHAEAAAEEEDEAAAGSDAEGSDSEDEDAASESGSEAESDGEEDGEAGPLGEAAAVGQQEEEEEEEEEEESEEEGWGQAAGGEEQPADALARLERCYLSRLLERLPTLTSILLTDYLGVVGSPSSKGAGPGASRSPTAGSSSALVDTAACIIAGQAWQRAVSQVPAGPGGPGQCDIRYTHL